MPGTANVAAAARDRKQGRNSMRAEITAAILVVTGVLATSSAFAQGKWTSLKPIPQGEEEVYGTAAGGKLYVLGGLGIFPGWEPKPLKIQRRG
jgi:hypothetical protein